MSRRASYKHQFVETLPEKLDEGVLFVSIRYSTCAHLCMCGCGREVVTPLHPTKWILTFDGLAVSLKPSIGSWSLDCQSHYWLTGGRVIWGEQLSKEEIDAVRARDADAARKFYKKEASTEGAGQSAPQPTELWWQRMVSWLQGT